MSLDLLAGVTDERAQALLAELSYDQLCGLLFAKASIEKKRVDIRTRPMEARVRVKRWPAHYCKSRPAGLEGECQFVLATGCCLHCGRAAGATRGVSRD